MGASASRGWDNQSLLDRLLESGLSLPPDVERAMRLVDRGDYFEEKSHRAYLDLAWRSGSLHLSAPSIYVSALNNLELAPGQHFLNVGSGSGYLSTIIGLILGHRGVNHGIEVNKNNVAFSRQRLDDFLSSSDAPCERDFCIPQFLHGNIFNLVIPSTLRINSTRRTTAPEDHDEDSDSDANEDDTVLVEDANESNDTQMDTEEANTEQPQSSDSQPGEGDDGDRRPLRPPRIFTLPIDPPPTFQMNGTNGMSFADTRSWPTYDRIYVGGGIRSRVQLQGLLRLLKIGGIMIAPVQDELLKITRLSENRISRVDLLSVSFASLVVPSSNDEAQQVESPSPEEPSSLLILCARFIRRLLRKRIESLHNGRPDLGRLVKVESHENAKKKRKKKDQNDDDVTNEDKPSSELSCSTDSGEDSTTDHSEVLEDIQGGNGTTVERSASNVDDTTVHPTRSESPGPQQDSGNMVRFLHHLLLRSRTDRNREQTPPPATNENAAHESERNPGSSADEGDDQSRIIVLNMSQEPDPPNTRDPRAFTNMRMRFRLRLAERFMAVLDGATEEANTDGENNASEEHVSDGVDAEPGSTVDCPGSDSQSNPRQRKEKRRRGLKYQPPTYKYRDEMRRILSEELQLPEFFVRHVFLM